MCLTEPKEEAITFSLVAASKGGNEFGGLLSKSQKMATLGRLGLGSADDHDSNELYPDLRLQLQYLVKSASGFLRSEQYPFPGKLSVFRSVESMNC